MSAESRLVAARRAFDDAQRALAALLTAIDELDAEVSTLRKAANAPRRAVVDCICQNPACRKVFKVRACDLRAGNKGGKFCSQACAKAVRRSRTA
jgi:hypothetical protein